MAIAKNLLPIFMLCFIASQAFAQQQKNPDSSSKSEITFRGVAELGYVAALNHKIQFSNSGTYFDYVKDGGQDVLFPVNRLSLELELKKKHTFLLLYQPLRLETQVLLEDDLVVDDLLFPASSNVKLLYNFPFYRLSYLREFYPNSDAFKFAFGATFQLRNATISFESGDGALYRTNRDLGIVPALKLRTSKQLNDQFYVQLEADGIYAPVSYLNGSDNEVIGAILDASFRAGMKVTESMKTFLNVRYLGGGAVGTSDDDEGPGDGYVRNWLNFMTVTAGFAYEL